MRSGIRLGPAAIFLAVVTMIVVTLALLTFSTARADLAMAERYAGVTAARYELKADGEDFLSRAAEYAASEGGLEAAEGVTASENGYIYRKENNGYRLEIEISRPDEDGSFEVISCSIDRLWENSDPVRDIWKG